MHGISSGAREFDNGLIYDHSSVHSMEIVGSLRIMFATQQEEDGEQVLSINFANLLISPSFIVLHFINRQLIVVSHIVGQQYFS